MHLCNNSTVYELVMLGSKVSGQLAHPTCVQNNLFLGVMTSQRQSLTWVILKTVAAK